MKNKFNKVKDRVKKAVKITACTALITGACLSPAFSKAADTSDVKKASSITMGDVVAGDCMAGGGFIALSLFYGWASSKWAERNDKKDYSFNVNSLINK